MGMFQRFWLALGVMGLMSFLGSLGISLVSARHYIAQQLYTQANDSATALALNLSQQPVKDPVTYELLVSAMFDNGHFQRVAFNGAEAGLDAIREQAPLPANVPGWFVRLLPLPAPKAVAEVRDGWASAGTVTVVPATGYAYESLWQGAQTLAVLSLGVALVAGWLGSLFLRKIAGALRGVMDQAQAIEERRFVTMPEPTVPELRRVTQALNHMVERVRSMFDEEAARLARIQREANLDPLTGLANRAHFESAFAAELRDDESSGQGLLFRLRLPRLAEINQRLGAEATDALIAEAGNALVGALAEHPSVLAGRLGGGDFAICWPALGANEGAARQRELVGVLTSTLRRAGLPFDYAVDAGRTPWHRADTAVDVLQRAEAAFLQAEGETPADADAQAQNWQQTLELGLREQGFFLQAFSVFDRQGKPLHDEGLLRLARIGGGEPEAAGRFMPQAAKLGLLPAIDREVVRLGLEQIRQRNSRLVVNLSGELMRDASLREQLRALLFRHPLQAPLLGLELSEAGFGVWQGRELAELSAFINSLKPLGVRVGLKHVGRRFEKLPRLHELGLAWLKTDPAFASDIGQQREHQTLVRAIVSVAHTLDMQVIAMGVNTRTEWDTLISLGVDGIGGPVTRTVVSRGES